MRRGPCPPCQSGREMIGADFVAGRIAKIGGICSREMIARSRRAFVGAAIREATGMKSIDLGLRGSRETNGGAVARRSEERRVGKEGVRPGRYRWAPHP